MRDAVGIGVGVASYGVSFGALGVTTGLSILETQFLSMVMFTGASQFALVGVIAAGGSSVSAIATALLLGFRNLPYAIRMSQLLEVKGWRRFTAAQLTIDESTAMGLAHEIEVDGTHGGKWAFWATGVSVFFFWNLATLLGSVAASAAGDPKALGLDAAVVAGFIALLWPQLSTNYRKLTAVAGAIATLIFIPLVAPGVPILIAGSVALVLGLRQKVGGDQ